MAEDGQGQAGNSRDTWGPPGLSGEPHRTPGTLGDTRGALGTPGGQSQIPGEDRGALSRERPESPGDMWEHLVTPVSCRVPPSRPHRPLRPRPTLTAGFSPAAAPPGAAAAAPAAPLRCRRCRWKPGPARRGTGGPPGRRRPRRPPPPARPQPPPPPSSRTAHLTAQARPTRPHPFRRLQPMGGSEGREEARREGRGVGGEGQWRRGCRPMAAEGRRGPRRGSQ